jgi:hypothetical protein
MIPANWELAVVAATTPSSQMHGNDNVIENFEFSDMSRSTRAFGLGLGHATFRSTLGYLALTRQYPRPFLRARRFPSRFERIGERQIEITLRALCVIFGHRKAGGVR